MQNSGATYPPSRGHIHPAHDSDDKWLLSCYSTIYQAMQNLCQNVTAASDVSALLVTPLWIAERRFALWNNTMVLHNDAVEFFSVWINNTISAWKGLILFCNLKAFRGLVANISGILQWRPHAAEQGYRVTSASIPAEVEHSSQWDWLSKDCSV